MITFEPYVIYGQKVSANQKPEPNMRVYNLAEGKHVTTTVATREATWRPQFTDDESVVVRLVGTELLIHNGCQFEKYDRKLVVPNISAFAVSSGHAPHHVACYTPATGSTPARVQVRRLDSPFAVVVAKNFFKSEKGTLVWNSKGTAILVLSSTEVDQSNQSYYGEQHIYLLNLTSQESFQVTVRKNGPIHAAKWNPNGREFCVCYGYMPAMVSLYNLRGDETFHINEGPRNDAFYNGFGNILLTCGFGNLGKGKMEFWDVEKKKQIVTIEVPNTTLFEWAPDGQHFVTATTTPRLRIDNGYRFWHYSGKLIKEVLYNSPAEELWEVKFRPITGYNKFEVRDLSKVELNSAGLHEKKKTSSESGQSQSKPVGAAKQDAPYVPPHLRKNKTADTTAKDEQKAGNKMTENEKKIFVVKKKLKDVSVLKARLANGEELQTNQLEKIAREPEFLALLESLGGTL
ncbi:eukaryotic translation initiation factor eIF2A [Oesophagostomum dentatum]|uniref:Eukaryotic translation initiation factor 2A n=1 Tax=Oesophagostomum dentatum TaxID=61180 RepID=A0A0B1TAG3_OESDE|nr:eukaryotic translation initiation factor eIF2A [Oesophagostomum dentatum]